MKRSLDNRLKKVEKKLREMKGEDREKIKVVTSTEYNALCEKGEKTNGLKYIILHELKGEVNDKKRP